jgi:hypothetical protein
MPMTTPGKISGDIRSPFSAARPGNRYRATATAAGRAMSRQAGATTAEISRLDSRAARKRAFAKKFANHLNVSDCWGRRR